jgi:hypothetical protein
VTVHPPTRSFHVGAIAAVRAALLGLGAVVLAGGCGGEPSGSLFASPLPPVTPVAASAAPVDGRRLLLLVLGPSGPALEVRDPRRPRDRGFPVDLPQPMRQGGVAAVVAAADGRLAAIGVDGSAWLADVMPGGTPSSPTWRRLRPGSAVITRSGPVLGGAWTVDGTGLVLLAGRPGSGIRRSTVTWLPADGTPPPSVNLAVEPDGSSVAVLPNGDVAVIGRDLDDHPVIARVARSGRAAIEPAEARAFASGGDLAAVAGDNVVRVGPIARFERGRLPESALPLDGPGGIGALSIAGDGRAIAVVRLDERGAAGRVEIMWRAGAGPGARRWVPGPDLVVETPDASVTTSWLP